MVTQMPPHTNPASGRNRTLRVVLDHGRISAFSTLNMHVVEDGPRPQRWAARVSPWPAGNPSPRVMGRRPPMAASPATARTAVASARS